MTFETAYTEARGFSLVSEDRMAVLWAEALTAPPGDFCEVGVYRGGSALLLRFAGPDRTFHLFDTFTGHPTVEFEDAGQWAGRFSDTDLDSVANRVEAEYWAGDFPSSMPPDWSPKLALIHVDVDTYRSTKDALDRLVPLMVKDGVLICDDYGFCPGAKRAIDEYATANPALFFSTPDTGQAVLRKAA